MNKKYPKRLHTLALTCFFLGVLFVFLKFYLDKNFGLLTPLEFVFHLKVPLTGTSSGQVWIFMKEVLAPTLIIFFPVRYGLKYLKKKVSFLKIGKYVLVTIIVISLVTTSIVLNQLNFFSYVGSQFTYSDFIEDNYTDPQEIELTFPTKKKNLIHIYVESLEVSYASKENGGASEIDLLPNLTKLAKDNLYFSPGSSLGGSYQVPGTNWTSAALVSQSSGLPVLLPLTSKFYTQGDKFMPGATTLGDILAAKDYNQLVMFGSDAKFGARNLYYETHGNYKIFDLNTAKQEGLIPQDYSEWWGFEDSKLFTFAKDKLTDLSRDSQPFELDLMTANTHSPDGLAEDSCTLDIEDDYSRAVACSDQQIGDFISWLKTQDYYDDTLIIITGDHLSMETAWFSDVSSDYSRQVYNVFINSAKTTLDTTREFTSFDIFPTTLSALGVTIPGDKLGLGTDLFSDTKTLAETYGVSKLTTELNKRSKYYEKNILKKNK